MKYALAALAAVLSGCAPSTARAGDGPPLGEPGSFPLAEIQRMVKEPALHVAFVPEAPLGITADLSVSIPADNPLTRAKVELGCELFFDPRLSRSRTVACASCHSPTTGWAGNRPAAGAGRARARNAPALANRILGSAQYWDGRVATLEEQALAALASPSELGSSLADVAQRVNGIEGYRLQFEAVFGGPADPQRVAKALAAFERTLLAGESKYDVHARALPFLESEPKEGDYLLPRKEALDAETKQHMSASALRGRALFLGKARCATCHAGENLSDERFHNEGVGMEAREPDLGRHLVTKAEEDKGAFKTPSLRGVAHTAPYMHDGSLATLRAVVDHYDGGGTKNPWLAKELSPLGLSEEEKQDLVAFLEEGLTGAITPVQIPRLP